MRRWLLRALLLLPLTAGCSGSQASLADLSQAAALHGESFAHFETWVSRAESSLSEHIPAEELADSLFAPLRLESQVLFARVERGGRAERSWVFPDAGRLAREVRWTRIALADGSHMDAAAAQHCPLDVPPAFREGKGQGPCVLLSRETRWGLAETMRVTVAYHWELE